jgi:dipeptidyl aminopeptidase/acylaminoacyl peptidase
MPPRKTLVALTMMIPLVVLAQARGQKPPLTLDDWFNSVSFPSVEISPNGDAVVIETERADWAHNRFRTDLWLYRISGDGGALIPLTRSGDAHAPRWSPDGRWIAYLAGGAPSVNAVPIGAPKTRPSQLYVISPQGGAAIRLTFGAEGIHAFSWSADSATIYFATRNPWTPQQEMAYRKEWKDVIQYRKSERGDTIFSVNTGKVLAAIVNGAAVAETAAKSEVIATTPYHVARLATSPDGTELAFATLSRSLREESRKPYGIYVVDLQSRAVRQLIHTLGGAGDINWSRDGRQIFFSYEHGNPTGPYEDPQIRIYAVNAGGGAASRWAADFAGTVNAYAVAQHDGIIFAGMRGTEVEPYTQSSGGAPFVREHGWPGSYGRFSTAAHSSHVALVYSSLQRPTEVYLATDIKSLEQARPITDFNKLFTERELPQGKPFDWTADDGKRVVGMLIYPPGKLGANHLHMFTLIHGGPEDADRNHFEADWYQWAGLAATHGYLVFEPNYRGSTGYGDQFALGIIPHIVSKPGKDILEGIQAVVRAGIADPDHLTVGGYSYGGYMTNWLITQTDEFKAAVTGAGAVEHVANWGNDDTSYDDAYFLGGLPWLAEANYNAEAAIWQIGKVRTPTHIVGGADDIRVYVGEDYLLERALHTRGIPCALLIFPGEGHGLSINPWHGKIKVREELKWLERFDPTP